MLFVSSRNPDKVDDIMSQPSYAPASHVFQNVRAIGGRRLSGQTLAELAVMVIVLMILAGSVLPVIADSILSTRIVRARRDAARIAATLVNFQRDNGRPLVELASSLPMPHIKDPWGHEFLVNVNVIRVGQTNATKADSLAIFVISAGPDGVIETPFIQARSTARAYGDDVIVRIQ